MHTVHTYHILKVSIKGFNDVVDELQHSQLILQSRTQLMESCPLDDNYKYTALTCIRTYVRRVLYST